VSAGANIYTDIPEHLTRELVEPLVETAALRLERIISAGQATPTGEWYDQDRHEWVVVLAGSASLRFEDETEPRLLRVGDHVTIAAHRRHRVEWTDPVEKTVWLALHFAGA